MLRLCHRFCTIDVRERECVEVGWRKSILLMAGCYSQLEVVMDKIINPLRPFEFLSGSKDSSNTILKAHNYICGDLDTWRNWREIHRVRVKSLKN